MYAGASPQYSFLLPTSCGLQTSSLRLVTTPQLVHSYIPVMTFLLSGAKNAFDFQLHSSTVFPAIGGIQPRKPLSILAFSFSFFAL
jgi:hypothetical protein